MSVASDSLFDRFVKDKTAPAPDVSLLVQDHSFRVNKAILASKSDFFRAMFESGFLEQDQDRIELKEEIAHWFEHLLAFIYDQSSLDYLEDEEEINTCELADRSVRLYELAAKYQVASLQKKCISMIISTFGKDFMGHICSGFTFLTTLNETILEPYYDELTKAISGDNLISIFGNTGFRHFTKKHKEMAVRMLKMIWLERDRLENAIQCIECHYITQPQNHGWERGTSVKELCSNCGEVALFVLWLNDDEWDRYTESDIFVDREGDGNVTA
ncbi:Hypothetical protein D9617_3g021380 [Elsinoe fawcettii]|nr:Hypothetical protein D9617_3g021380 [Elsinoe fawcettii]